MKTVSVVAQKGGTRKTTLCLAIACAAVRDHLTAAVFDLDPQATAASWGDRREADLPVVVPAQPPRLPRVLAAAAGQGVDLAIVDTAPRVEQGAVAAARAADLVLIPCRPCPPTSAGGPSGCSHRSRPEALALPLRRQRLDVPALQPPGAQTAVAEPMQRLRRLHQNVAPHAPRAVRALPVALEQAHQIEVQLAHRTLPYRLFRDTAQNLVTGTGMVNRRVLSETLTTRAAVRRRLRAACRCREGSMESRGCAEIVHAPDAPGRARRPGVRSKS